MEVGSRLALLREVYDALLARELPEHAGFIADDALIGPALFIPGRRFTGTDLKRGADVIANEREPGVDIFDFNLQYIGRFIETLMERLQESQGLEDLVEKLRVALKP
jgi:hypothetical protein